MDMDTYFIRILPNNPGDLDDMACTLTVTRRSVVIQEPITARSANDDEAIERAKQYVAERLGIPIEYITG